MTDPFESIAKSHRVVGAAALLISVLLHLALLRLNPSIHFTGGRGFQSPVREAVSPRLTLDSLRMDPVQSHSQNEDEHRDADFAGDLDMLTDSSVPEEIEIPIPESGSEVMGYDFTPPTPAGLPGLEDFSGDSVNWTPRAELLAIREQRVEERVDARPRRIVERQVEPEPVADILPPVDYTLQVDPLIAGAFSGGDLGLAGEDNAIQPLTRSPVLPDYVLQGADGDEMMWIPELRPGGPALEDSGFVHTAEIADQYLRITAQAYVDPSKPDYRYFKLQLRPAGPEALDVLPREIVFVLDGTARISPETFRQSAQAVVNVLNRLQEEDRFNIILLQDTAVSFFDEPQPATPIHLARVRGRLAQARPQGRGDLFSALDLLLRSSGQSGLLPVAVVITDGVPTMSVEESSKHIQRFSRENRGETAVFTVGVGRQVNRYLLDFLSFHNRGDSLVTEQAVQIGDALARTMEGIRRPVFRHVSHRFIGGERVSVFPQSLTHLYVDRPLILVGRVPADQPILTFQIIGYSGEGAHDMLYSLQADRIAPGPWSLRQDWAWQALLNDAGLYLRTGDASVRDRIRTISRTYGISLPFPLNL
jgi:hypothetical protein